MKHILSFIYVAVLLSFVAGCTEEDPTEPQTIAGKPTNVTLQKLSANSFSVTWTRASNDKGTDVVTINRTAPTAAQWQLNVPSPTSTVTVQDTSITTSASFTVTVASKDSTSAPATITISSVPVPAPTSVQVTSLSSTQIGVRWTRSNAESSTEMIIAEPVGGGAPISTAVTGGTAEGTISGLSAGITYNISVASSSGDRSAAIQWATASRSGILTLYETADPTAGHNSGLILGSTSRTASITGSEKNQIDVVLATDNSAPGPPYLSLQGADVAGSGLGLGARSTRFGNLYFIVTGGLDKDFYTESFANEIQPTNTAVNYFGDFAAVTNQSVILLTRTADDHYARIEIIPQPNGYLWKDVPVGGDSFRAIDVRVSYQTLPDLGYASRPTGARKATNTPKIGGARKAFK